MSRLFLFRHAKASWAEPGMRDFDRKLSEAGWAEGKAMDKALQARDFEFDVILSSSAVRTRQTFDAINPDKRFDGVVKFDERLYSTDAPGYLEVAAEFDMEGDLMMIGHNPMLEDLAIGLGQNGNDEAYSQISMGFATASIAILHFDGSFKDIQTAKCQLEDYLRPGYI